MIYSIRTQVNNGDRSVRVTPNWPGTFSTTEECNLQKCCCIHGQVNLVKLKPNYLRVLSQVEGYGCPANRRVNDTVTMPTGFHTELFLMGGVVDVTLSSDSRVIKLYNQNVPGCSGRALRSNARSIAPIDSMKILLITLVVFIGKNALN